MEKEKNQVHLRSEKVRSIIGKIPPLIIRQGNFIISSIILLLLIFTYIFPVKEYVVVEMDLYTRPAFQISRMAENGFFSSLVREGKVFKNQLVGYIYNDKDSVTKLYSCLNGNIRFNCVNDDCLKKGEIIFSVTPQYVDQIYGISYIKCKYKNKIQQGQKVYYSLDGDSNTIIGEVSKCIKIYDFSSNYCTYKIEIIFNKSFFNNNKTINIFTINKFGTAKILISDEPILKRVCQLPFFRTVIN